MYQVLHEFSENFRHNLFKPLLLFFSMGFLVPILGVNFEFPHVMDQGLTIYLLVSIGWNGGEELAELSAGELTQALEFMGVGFVTNLVIGIVAYLLLRSLTKLRKVDMFSILCGASSSIAVPAVQRLAIPEASPTLPLAASLGLTFSFNVTLGIPLSIQIAKTIRTAFPAG